jgi:hypothetical protein
MCQWSLFWIIIRICFRLKKISSKTFGPHCIYLALSQRKWNLNLSQFHF